MLVATPSVQSPKAYALANLAPSNNAAKGAALIGYLGASRTAGETVADVLGRVVEIEGFGGGTSKTAAQNSTALDLATTYLSLLGGGTIQLGVGVYKYNAYTPKTYVDVAGKGKYSTTLDCRLANGVASGNISIDARGSGSGGFPADRKIISFNKLTILGSNAGNQIKGIAIGWNMRSMDLLHSVRVKEFADWGIGFLDQNWNIALVDVEVDTCGGVVTNSTGVYKDPAVDASTWNYITFERVQVEGCGSASSAAGGMNIQTTTANRGLYLNDCIVEGNLGTDQIYITNQLDLQLTNLYIEVPDNATCVTAVELSGCKGSIRGGFWSGSNAANNDQGLQLKNNSDMHVSGLYTAAFGVAHYDLQGSKMHGRRLQGSPTFALNATAQLTGDISPRFAARKAANQTAIATGVFTKVTFATEDYDETSAFDNATNYRFTPRNVGRYQLQASVSWDDVSSVGDQFIISIYKNGAAYKSKNERAVSTEPWTQTIAAQVDVTATSDYFEIYVRHTTGVNRTIVADSAETWFSGHLLQ